MNVRTQHGQQVEIDMGMDWREAEPVMLDVGPVLSIQDAIGNNVSALYGRAEARDFFDLDAIRASGHYSDAQLIEAAIEREPRSCTNPGKVSRSLRRPPPGRSVASSTSTRSPASASRTAATSPFGSAPSTTASTSGDAGLAARKIMR